MVTGAGAAVRGSWWRGFLRRRFLSKSGGRRRTFSVMESGGVQKLA